MGATKMKVGKTMKKTHERNEKQENTKKTEKKEETNGKQKKSKRKAQEKGCGTKHSSSIWACFKIPGWGRSGIFGPVTAGQHF